MKYRLTSGSHGRHEAGGPKIYEKGDLIELTAEESSGASLAGRIEPVTDGGGGSVADPQFDAGTIAMPAATIAMPAAADLAANASNLIEGTVAKVAEAIAVAGPEALAAIEAAERSGKGRKGILAAVEARRAEIGDDA